MRAETVQVTWHKQIKIFFSNDWLVRWCTFGEHWGFVGNSGEDAWKFISAPDWVCAGCRPHVQAIREAPIASLGGGR